MACLCIDGELLCTALAQGYNGFEGFIIGNKITSLILDLSVNNIVNRSIPRPQPPAGGKPCSSAAMYP